VRRLRLIIAGLLAAGITLLAACATTPGGPPIAPPDGKTWARVFDVEFDGASLDTTKLTPCFDWNYGGCTSSFNDGKEHYMPSQVQLSNGVAKLVAEPLDPPQTDRRCLDGVCTYKSGLVSTARPDQSSPYLYSFTYGYVESRMKLPTTTGMGVGFWMLPANPDYQYGSEIDILEYLGGKPKVIYQTYHYNNRASSFKVNNVSEETNGSCPVVDYSADFHTYGVDWQPDQLAFFIDGIECGRFTDASQIEREPMQIILSLGVDNQWQRTVNLVLPSQTVTDHVEVDYLKVWQAK
jgi:beta-glucanase (GH16 family)